jgi:hypothetical protein
MTEKFKLNDIVRIRRFHIGHIGRIINIEKDVTRDASNRYLPVRFDIIKIWVYHKGGSPSICRCMKGELEKASKIESERYEEAEEKHIARGIAEQL